MDTFGHKQAERVVIFNKPSGLKSFLANDKKSHLKGQIAFYFFTSRRGDVGRTWPPGLKFETPDLRLWQFNSRTNKRRLIKTVT